MPGPSGPITLQVFIRSSQGSRIAGRQVFEYLRDTGRGAVYSTGGTRDEIDFMGNLETIPPYEHKEKSFPAGRVIEDPLILDTDWLAVGHVDEMVQFLPADNTLHGWVLFVADPIRGLQILQNAQKAGHGSLQAFSQPDESFPSIPRGVPNSTIDEILTDKLIADNERFAEHIKGVRDTLQEKTGIPDTNAHWVPMILETGVRWGPDDGVAPDLNYSVTHGAALYPGVLNGVVLSNSIYLFPKPWRPVIDGKDIIVEATNKVYEEVGFGVVYINAGIPSTKAVVKFIAGRTRSAFQNTHGGK
ncbi:uncharacterized protein F4822DRAFT_434845 [Hypoxylon trugodes]|uniref:uncharacterized protein n=1 Tax=Hypoxylon trugodes TaxID=326681 RepID=UPI0021A10B95|nr:uncharacterized protein F4822DRAFT_434845 [Hypoxylon trugodes]KAI1382914.1 hypothetical protein F4822DRAFT_434845 [Hypoxylon trugodes]